LPIRPARCSHRVLIEPVNTQYHPHKTYTGGGAEAHGTTVDANAADEPLPFPPAGADLGIERYTLDNGLTVVMWDRAPLPLVHGRLVVHAGAAHDPKGAEGVAQLVGASDVNADDLVFDDRSLSIRVDDLVRSLGWELRSPGYELGDEQKSYLKARLGAVRTADRVRYERDLLAAIYGEGHPYARVPMTADSIDKIHRDLVMDWARDHIVPANSVLILAGQFDGALIKAHVSGGKRTPPVAIAEGRDEPAWIAGNETRPSPTLELDIAFPTVPGFGRDYAKRLVLQQILESRLNDLRAKQAITYGFGVDYEPRVGGGMWRITGEVDATRADEAARAVMQILSQLRSDPESYRAAFVLARQKVLESLLVGGTGSLGITERLEAAARFDLPDDFYDDVARHVAALTLKAMPAFVASELDEKREVFGAYGNADAVKAALAAAKPAH
jgi:predicted Zn-dependent peptidase